MIGNYIRGLTPEQRSQMFSAARSELFASTTPEERAQVLGEWMRELVASLTPAQRNELARQMAAMLDGGPDNEVREKAS